MNAFPPYSMQTTRLFFGLVAWFQAGGLDSSDEIGHSVPREVNGSE